MHAREVVVPDPLSEQARIQLEEESKPGKPTHRLWGKQPPPGQIQMKIPPLPRLDRGGEPSHLDFDFEKDLEREFEKMEKEVGIPVVEGPKLWETDEEDENEPQESVGNRPRRERTKVKTMRVTETESGLGGETVKTETWESRDSYLGWMHQNTLQSLQDLVDMVPTSREEGEHCGSQIERLVRERDIMEQELDTVRMVKNERVDRKSVV